MYRKQLHHRQEQPKCPSTGERIQNELWYSNRREDNTVVERNELLTHEREQILHTLCPVKEARHKGEYTIWIYLHEVLEEAMQIHGNRNWEVVVSFHSFWGGGELTGCKRELSWVMGNV